MREAPLVVPRDDNNTEENDVAIIPELQKSLLIAEKNPRFRSNDWIYYLYYSTTFLIAGSISFIGIGNHPGHNYTIPIIVIPTII